MNIYIKLQKYNGSYRFDQLKATFDTLLMSAYKNMPVVFIFFQIWDASKSMMILWVGALQVCRDAYNLLVEIFLCTLLAIG